MADRAPRWRSSLVVGAGLLAFAVLLFVVRPGTEEPARVAENSPELRAPGSASMEASSSPAIAQRETESAAATRDASSTGDLLVRILDANAEPVSDLAVTLEVERQSAERARPELLSASTWSSAERDASDAIAIPADEVEGALRRARHVRADGFAVELRVRLAFATPRCTRYVCEDLDAMPRSLALQLEGSGFLRIEAVTPEGSPFEGALHARVRARAAPDAGDPGARRFVGTREALWPSAPRRVRVPLDHELELKLWADDHRFQVHRVTVKGPTREGEEQELRVVLRYLPVLTGRLLSLAGEPMPKQRFLAAYDDPWRGLVSTEATTDDAGRFRVQLVGEPLSPLPRLRFLPIDASSRVEDPEALARDAHATVHRIPLSFEGTRELGDLRLRRSGPSLLVAGVVVDEAGQPLARVDVLAFGARAEAAEQFPGEWSFLPDETTTTARDGRFELRSAEPCEVVRVSAHAPGRALREVVRAAPGEQGLRLVLAPGASIRGSVMLDSKRTAASVRVGLIDAQSQTKRTPLHPDGRFRFSGIRPGVYSLELRAAQGLLLARVDGIELEEGLDAEDPRLAAIDLRGRFATLQLRLRDERGDALVRKQGTWWSAHDAAEIFSWTTDEQGELELCVPLELSEIALAREGGLPQRVLAASGGQELRLGPGLVTKLELAQRVELPRGMELVAVLEPARSRASFALPPLRFAFGGPVAEGLLPTAGRYRVRWQLRDASLVPREQACGEAQEIDVDRAGERGYARVEPPEEEELRRAIEELLR